MVGNILRLMLTRGLSIIRWNNFPRVVDIKQMDNVGMTLHTALFLAYHDSPHRGISSPLEEKRAAKNKNAASSFSFKGEGWDEGENQSLDTLYLMKKIIFMSFADLILSDINSGTKNYIKKCNPEIFDQVYSRAYHFFLDQESPEYLRKDFEEVMFHANKPREDAIILAAKKYVGIFEAKMNARVFPEIFEIPLSLMQDEIQDFAKNLHSLAFLLENAQAEKYLAHIYRLSFSMRWNQYTRKTPISVMSHKVIVTYLSYIIGMTGNSHGETNDIQDMMLRAIYHDVPEVITGDIITPTKKAVPGFQELLEKVEETMLDDYLFGYISKEYKQYLENYILHPFLGESGEKVKYADIFSALLEAKVEMDGSAFFKEKYAAILQYSSGFSHVGVEFLFRELLFHFDAAGDDVITPSYR